MNTRIPQIKKLIQNNLPEWTIKLVSFLGEGDFCAAYLVNDEWIFRFAKHNAARESLRREVCLLPKLVGNTALQIPLPQLHFLADEDAEKSFIAYRILPGRALCPEIYFNFDNNDQRLIAVQTANFLNQFHSANIVEAEKCGVPKNDYSAQYSHLQTQVRFSLFPLLGKTEIEFIETTIKNYLETAENFEFRVVLLHGDFSHDHILYDEKTNRICSIIDFGDMMLGDPAWDFLWLYEEYGVDFLSRLMPFYFEADKLKLLRRVYYYSILQAVEWTADCLEKNDDDFEEALNQLKNKILTAEKNQKSFFRINEKNSLI